VNTITFATLKFVETLEAAGLPTNQAKAIAEAFREATGTEIVTRDFLKAELEASRNGMMKWVAGMLIAQAALIAALVKLF
jgi:hypothetical protein